MITIASCILVMPLTMIFVAVTIDAHVQVQANDDHVYSNVKPEFIRYAVESIPWDNDTWPIVRINARPVFGDEFLPLRSAVESVPTVKERNVAKLRDSPSTRSFVRDSVESVPIGEQKLSSFGSFIKNFDLGAKINSGKLTHGLHPDPWPVSDKYTAFITQENSDDFYSQPYRAGSPHQKLLKTVNIEPMDQNDTEHQSNGTLEQVGLLNQQWYGTLAPLKRKYFKKASKVLCYMSNWGFYRKEGGHFMPEQIDSKLCSVIIYSFASLDPDLLTIREFDPWVDLDNQYYRRVTSLGVPVLIALGGWTDSTGSKYSRLASDNIKRQVFASSAANFLQRHGFSGLHLDWNYPKCWQSDCSKGPVSDRPNLTKLLRELRTEFQRVNPKFQVGVAISGYKEVITEAYELSALSDIVDYMTVMTYDYHGAWERQTGHVSPLYGSSSDKYPQYNTDYTMQLLLKMGAKRDKLVLSIPFYGQSFTLERNHLQLVATGISAIGPGKPGEFTNQPGMLAYYEICKRITKSKWWSDRDAGLSSGPYAMLNDQWVGYEDPTSVQAKAQYAANNNFSGVAAWTVDLDDFQNDCCSESYPLLRAINRELGRLDLKPPTQTNCERPTSVGPMAPQMTTINSDGSAGSGQNHDHTTSWPIWEASTSPTFSTTRKLKPASTTKKAKVTTTASSSVSWWISTTGRPNKPTRTTSRSTNTTIPVPVVMYPVVQASNCKSGEFYADLMNCNAYYLCIIDGELLQQFCPGGLQWNNEAKGCDWPSYAQCSVKRDQKSSTIRPKPAPTSESPRNTTYLQPSRKTTEPSVHQHVSSPNCNEGEYYTHRNCAKYYICVNGALVPSECGGELHWDAISKICDWPEKVQCVTSIKYLKAIHASRATEEDPCNGEERVPYPSNCSKYLFCLWNRLQAGDCPPGLHYSEAITKCDWPAAAKCIQDSGNGTEGAVSSGSTKPPALDNPAPTSQKPNTIPSPTYTTGNPELTPLDGYYKIVCYFTNWAWYRKGLGRYTPDDINTKLCTHVVYGFAVLDYSELILRTHDSWADIENNFYTRVSSLKNKGIKVSLALGGWNDSQGDKYSRLVRSPSSRARFIRHAVEFIKKYGFEGLDLDWEYPVCWQTECDKGFKEEKEGFTAWVRELSAAFKPQGLLLSTAVSPSKKIIDAGYDVPQLSHLFDWIAVMTYDFHGQWDKKTGHVAPLYHHPGNKFEYFNANFSLSYWIEKGAPSRKIVMGIPLYGQSFTLESANNSCLNAKASGPGQAGEFTRASGFLAYYEICERVNHQGWKVVHDELGRMGPYAHKGTQWVSYDDAAIIRKKAQLMRSLDLGGGMVWALDLDDFRNRCGNGVHPLLHEIHDVLKDSPSLFEPTNGLTPVDLTSVEEQSISTSSVEGESVGELAEAIGVESVNEDVQPVDPVREDSNEGESLGTLQENEVDPNADVEMENLEIYYGHPTHGTGMSNDFKVVCYFTNWAWYRQDGGKFLPEDINSDLCTHIVYGFAVLSQDSLTIQPHDSWADLDNKFYERVVAYRKKGVKVTLAIGGWNDSAGDKYARLVRKSEARAQFIRHAVDFIEQYNFDGLDLDWEYPVCWQVDCKKGNADEKNGFTALVRELSHAFRLKGLILSAAVSPNKKIITAAYDIPELSRYFDWISVMAYDYHGQWDKRTGHVSPMYDHPEGTVNFNANFSINYWISRGTNRRKLIMGIPMYGQSFSLAETTKHQLNAPTYGGGEAGEATRAIGFLAYYEICLYIRQHRWNVVRDARGRIGPFAYLADQWVSFDDAPMVRHKSEYIKAMGLGGAMIWALDLDDFKNYCGCESYPLLKTINRVLRGLSGPQPKCVLEQREKTTISNDDTSTINSQIGTHMSLNPSSQNALLSNATLPVLIINCDEKN
ncbi:probable chitinase 10 [Drosophila suzukii]|uniref:Probable chitinase 10 n=1 Tax=Drosophila suzukii TaxID=28584 RepID=A0ABM4TX29_DROSZ